PALLWNFFAPSVLRAQDPELLIAYKDDPKDAKKWEGPIQLRPNVATPLFVYVQNPSKEKQTAFVELFAGGQPVPDTKVKLDLEGKEKRKVTFPPLKVPPKEAKDWPQVEGPPFNFEIRLTDEDKKVVGSTKGVEFLSPGRYLKADAQYDKTTRRLSVEITPEPGFFGGDCQVELVLPRDRMPAMLAPPGATQLEGA